MDANQSLEQLNKTVTSSANRPGGNQTLSSVPSEKVLNDSLCTKDRNIRDALEYMQMLQELTINSSLWEHTKLDLSSDRGKKVLNQAFLKQLKDLELKEVLEKSVNEMTSVERVVLTLHLVDQQVSNIDNLVTRICAEQEKDFLNAYSGHMNMVTRELHNFKRHINSAQFELQKNVTIKNLQAEVDYFQEEALQYRALDKQQALHINAVHQENEGLRDDAYVLRQALLNTKVKQRELQKQLEETKNSNLELMVQVQSLQTQMREQMIEFQKQQLIAIALHDTQALQNSEKPHKEMAIRETSAALTNINVNAANDPLSSGSKGNEACQVVSLNASSANESSRATTTASDEQGLRAFLFKLLNSKHLFSTSDMVDQIEAFIQIKIDRCNHMVASFRDRLAKAEKETQRALLENKRVSTDQFEIQRVFKECMEQVQKDRRRDEQRRVYRNTSLLDPTRHVPDPSAASGFGMHTKQRCTKRLQSAHSRSRSGTNATYSLNASSRQGAKLTARHSQPSKGIFVLKSKIGRQSQADRRLATTAKTSDDLDLLSQNEPNEILYGTSRVGRNANVNRTAFTTLQDKETAPLVGPSPLTSPNGVDQFFSANMTSSSHLRLSDFERRQIIENFLKDEHVFQLLYETVFSSPTEQRGVRHEEILQTNSEGQLDIDGNELAIHYVNSTSDANEQLLEAVVLGASPLRPVHRARKATEKPRVTGSFFLSENNEPEILAIEDDPFALKDREINRKKPSASFFVTLQDATRKQEKRTLNRAPNSQHTIDAQTLRSSPFEEDKSTTPFKAKEDEREKLLRETEEEDQQQSHEVQDQVNQLYDQMEEPAELPLASPGSGGNLNVQTLIQQSKQRSGRQARPQSSRPILRPKFNTLDSRQNRLVSAAAGTGLDQYVSARNLKDQGGATSLAKNQTDDYDLQPKQSLTAQLRRPLPGPSFMIRDRSEFINHMLELETMGRISQKAVNQKHLSPRSSRLLASRYFMNRNSTAGSSIVNQQKHSGELGSMTTNQLTEIHQACGLRDTAIGRTRPLSGRVASVQASQRLSQKRQRLRSAKNTSDYPQPGGMFLQVKLATQIGKQSNLMTGVLSSTSSNTFFNQIQK